MHLSLTPHSNTPPRAVRGVFATLYDNAVSYRVDGADALALPPLAPPGRADGLWRATCFELFVMPAGGVAYREFNFSPSGQWAAYGFDGYRAGMRELAVEAAPVIARDGDGAGDGGGDTWRVALSGIAIPPGRVGLNAVIEERCGTRSYWAIAHPPGAPDFHHEACFALTIAAPKAP